MGNLFTHTSNHKLCNCSFYALWWFSRLRTHWQKHFRERRTVRGKLIQEWRPTPIASAFSPIFQLPIQLSNICQHRQSGQLTGLCSVLLNLLFCIAEVACMQCLHMFLCLCPPIGVSLALCLCHGHYFYGLSVRECFHACICVCICPAMHPVSMISYKPVDGISPNFGWWCSCGYRWTD